MSILPSRAQDQGSSSSISTTQNLNFNHGNSLLPLSSPGHFSGSQSLHNQVPGSLAPVTQGSGASTKEVTELKRPNGRNSSSRQNTETQSRNHSGGRGFGSGYSKGRMSGANSAPRSQQSCSAANSSQGTGRRGQMISGNHLLNFQYDPINRPQHRPPPPPRRQYKIKPYNKDLFLQANYKFVVLDTGNYTLETMDPDKMLQWEDIICVRYSTPFPVQCPICLEYPLCPQITSCGHIFCFPCILQHLLMGEEDHKGDTFKRCPLCFVMISSKELYTIYIENVKQYVVGDTIEFMLLSREKDSFALSQKRKQETRESLPGCDEINDPFSKFTLTSDVELSVRKAISDLDSWLVHADSGLVDDIEKLPYVCAAMEQLEQRKKYWNEHRATGSNKVGPKVPRSTENAFVAGNDQKTMFTNVREQTILFGNLTLYKSNGANALGLGADAVESVTGQHTVLSSSFDENTSSQIHLTASTNLKDKEMYNFYQAIDGQHVILHPLNMKCLLHHYGSYEMLPHRISGKILQFESVTQSEAIRRRFRYLSHFSLTTTFQLCEIDLCEMLPPEALAPYMDEIKKREKQRKQLARKDRKDKMKAEAALVHSVPILPNFGHSSYDDSPTFSMDDFEALGSSPVSSSPLNVGERRLFSSVTRLGFASAHDSPSLKNGEINTLLNNEVSGPSGVSGTSGTSGTPSFATIISRENSEAATSKTNETGKKGKKPSRVLLSTSGGRKY